MRREPTVLPHEQQPEMLERLATEVGVITKVGEALSPLVSA